MEERIVHDNPDLLLRDMVDTLVRFDQMRSRTIDDLHKVSAEIQSYRKRAKDIGVNYDTLYKKAAQAAGLQLVQQGG